MKIASSKYFVLHVLICAAITAYYYAPALDNFFLYDDYNFLGHTGEGLTTFLLKASNLRLFGNYIMWVNLKLFGTNHTAYNLFDILVHSLNLTLLYLLMKTITGNEKFACVASAVFAAMSVYGDAVLYKAAVSTVMDVSFYCLTLLFYLKGKENVRFYYGSLLTFMLGMLVKEECASLPVMIVFIEVVIYRNVSGLKGVLKRITPYSLMIAAYIVASITQSRYNNVRQYEFETASSFSPIRTLVGGFYSFFLQPDGVSIHPVALLSLLALLVALALYVSNNKRIMLFGLGWVFIAFLPQSYSASTSLNPLLIILSMSRHLYIPSIGAAIVIASVLLFSFDARRRYAIDAAVIGALSLLVLYNGPLIHYRSMLWGHNERSIEMRHFLHALNEKVSAMEYGAYVLVDDPPARRAEMTGALQAFFPDHLIYIDDPSKVSLKGIRTVFFIHNTVKYDNKIQLTRIDAAELSKFKVMYSNDR